jgi:hypothetical protein
VAALAGVTPVTKESGKHRAVHFRWACNKQFRKAITTFADNSRHASPWAAKIYHDAITAGKDHPHAVRILARAWIRVHLALLERQSALQPRPAPRSTTPHPTRSSVISNPKVDTGSVMCGRSCGGNPTLHCGDALG